MLLSCFVVFKLYAVKRQVDGGFDGVSYDDLAATLELSDLEAVSCVGGFYRWAGFEDDLLFMAKDSC